MAWPRDWSALRWPPAHRWLSVARKAILMSRNRSGPRSGGSETLGPIQRLERKDYLHRFKVVIAMDQHCRMFQCNSCDKTIRCGRGNSVLTKLRGMLPRLVPPGWLEGQSHHGRNHRKNDSGRSVFVRPVMSSSRIHSVTAVSPFTIRGFSWD